MSPDHRKTRLSASVLVSLCIVNLAAAHDGGFGHSRRTIFLAANGEGLVLEYRITQNRDEALAELALIDGNRDGKISPEEKDRYFTERAQQLAKLLQVQTTAGQPLPLKFVRYDLQHSLGQVFRFTITTSATEVLLEERNFPHKPGLVRILPGDGVKVELARPADLSHADRVSLRVTRVGK
jgi:hypothetical protein